MTVVGGDARADHWLGGLERVDSIYLALIHATLDPPLRASRWWFSKAVAGFYTTIGVVAPDESSASEMAISEVRTPREEPQFSFGVIEMQKLTRYEPDELPEHIREYLPVPFVRGAFYYRGVSFYLEDKRSRPWWRFWGAGGRVRQ